MIKRIYYIYMNFIRQMNKKNVSAHAASIAFFTYLAIIPTMMLLCSILPYTPIQREDLLQIAMQFMPSEFDGFVMEILTDVYSKVSGVITFSILFTIWSSGKGMLSMIRGLNAIYDVEENRNFVILRVIACFYTILFLLATIFLLLLTMVGIEFQNRLDNLIPGIITPIRSILHFRIWISFGIFTLVFAVLYSTVPSKKQRFMAQLPGALFSAAVWSVTSWAFSLYINVFHGFSTYGTFTTVIMVMVYLYIMMYILLIGAYINTFFAPVYVVLNPKRLKEKRKELKQQSD